MTIPIKVPLPSTTGSRLIPVSVIRRAAEETCAPRPIVIAGDVIASPAVRADSLAVSAPAACQQPADDASVPGPGTLLLEKDVRLGDHTEHLEPLPDHGESGDAVFGEHRGNLPQRRVGPDRDHVLAHQFLDLHVHDLLGRPKDPRPGAPPHRERTPTRLAENYGEGAGCTAQAARVTLYLLGHHLDRAARAFGSADPAALAEVESIAYGSPGAPSLITALSGQTP